MTRVERAVLVAIALVLPTSIVHAQSPEAEVLFREGRRLIKLGKLAEGCDKLEASERAESSVGTLLNLGDCREKQGRIATAWAAFRKADAMARRSRDDGKRRLEAQKRANTLEPKLSYLVLQIERPVAGLVVRRDGDVVERAAWNTAVPVDPDSYVLIAEAPGHKPWRTEVPVDGRLKRRVIAIPALEREHKVTAVAPPPPPAPVIVKRELAPLKPMPVPEVAVVVRDPQPHFVDEPRPRPRTWTPMRKGAVGVAVVGAAALAGGIYLGVRATDLQSESNQICPGTVCDDPRGLQLNDDAQRAALGANVLYVAGGAAIAGGIAMWFLGAPSRETVITPALGGDRAGVSIGGRF